MYWKISSMFTLIGSLPSRSSTATAFILLKETCPFASWNTPGKVLSSHFVSLQILRISLLSSTRAVGIAKRIWSMLYFSTFAMMLSRPPTIGTPSVRRPHLFGLSSITQHGFAVALTDVFSSLSIICPAAPAPMIMVLCVAIASFSRLARSSVI